MRKLLTLLLGSLVLIVPLFFAKQAFAACSPTCMSGDCTIGLCDTCSWCTAPAPSGACPGGCSSGFSCQFIGGDITNPSDWGCRSASSPSPGGGGTTPGTSTAPPPCPAAGGGGGVSTALGCIPTDDPAPLVKWFLYWGILAGGGIAFILSLWGGITIILAAGNPEKINDGKQIIGSAPSRLLVIVFSIFLLRFIGVDVLQIPEFIK